MDSSSAKKKVSLRPKSELDELLAQQPVENLDEAAQKEAQKQLHYQGEIFDQFYRPLSVQGGVERLRELASEQLPPLEAPKLLRIEQRERIAAELQEAAEILAHQIYTLAQKARETELDVYLSCFNVVLSHRTCAEQKSILDRANDYFTEHYYTAIRERGERPEISHQVVKRVGHANSDRIAKIVGGLDLQATARTLWDIYHGSLPDKYQRMTDILLDCTDSQVRALRDEFRLIPCKLLASQLHSILYRAGALEGTALKRTISRSDVSLERKMRATRSREDARLVSYVLSGRPPREVQLISMFYALKVQESGEAESYQLRTDIESKLLQSDAQRAVGLLDGWTSEACAEAVMQLLYSNQPENALVDSLSDPSGVTDEELHRKLFPYYGKFGRRRVLRTDRSLENRLAHASQALSELLVPLTPEQFIAVNELLRRKHGIEIPSDLLEKMCARDPRRKAELLFERIEAADNLEELARPLWFRDYRECSAVVRAFEAVTGTELPRVIRDKMPLSRDEEFLLDMVITGKARWSIQADLFAFVRGEFPESTVWDNDHDVEGFQQTAVAIAETLVSDQSPEQKSKAVLSTLEGFSPNDRQGVERVFYEVADPPTALVQAIAQFVDEETSARVYELFRLIDTAELAASLAADPLRIRSLRHEPPAVIRSVREEFEHITGTDILTAIEAVGVDRASGTEKRDALALSLIPEVFEVRSIMNRIEKANEEDGAALREVWNEPLPRLLAFEESFDQQFPRLRRRLKALAAEERIPIEHFVEAVLRLEGVDPKVIDYLVECFDAVDIHGLLRALGENRDDQGTIEECFDLGRPEQTLRRSIKDMKVDLDLINETLLHIEGYYPGDTARELDSHVQQLEGAVLGHRLLEILSLPTPEQPNHRIPPDINWMDETTHQIELAYNRIHECDLVTVCWKKQLPLEQLDELAPRMFGFEVTQSARELYKLLDDRKSKAPGVDPLDEVRLCAFLETRGTRHLKRLKRACDLYWAKRPGCSDLLEEVAQFFTEPNAKKRLINLLTKGVPIVPDEVEVKQLEPV